MSIPIPLNPLGINKNKRSPLTLTATQTNSTVKLTAAGNPIVNGLEYRTNSNNRWMKYNIDTVISLDDIDDYVQFRNKEEQLSLSGNDYVKFVMTGKIAASGNIQSMLNYSESCSNYCYYNMFKNCTSLITAPILPSISLALGCYSYMFVGCTSLLQAPELPATTLKTECYCGMFQGCTSLLQAPNLPATTLANSCYSGMFLGCNFTSTPYLPATTLAHSCYYMMFAYCSSLKTVIELPATTLANSCYYCMFLDCKSINSIPSSLPATTLYSNCYRSMFNGCTSLTQAPELPATTLATNCYYAMFANCSSLTEVPELPAKTLANKCYESMFIKNEKMQKMDVDFESWSVNNSNISEEWVKYIFTEGVFLKPENLSEEYGYSRIPFYFISFDKDKPLTLTAVESSTVKIVKNGSPRSLNVYYKKNNGEWIQYDVDTVIDLNEGDFVQFKNTTNQFSTGKDNFYKFVMTGEIKASGNVQSLVNFSDTADWYAFRKLFQNCVSLIEAPTVLPAKHVSGYAYASMFGKTSITNMPIMLAEDFGNEACYYMFEECPITYAKLLDKKGNNGVSCFERMFNNCASLNVIDVDFIKWDTVNGNNEHKDWCYGIASSGTFLKKPELTKTFDNNRIKPQWNVYNPLRYIKATGTQYINTNIIPSENFEIEVCCSGVMNFGSRTGYKQNEFRFSISYNQIDFAFGNDLYSYSKSGIGNEKNIIKYGTDGKFYINNELVYSSQSSISQYYPIYAFVINSNGTPIFSGTYPSQIFRIKIWRNGTLISDIIPVDNNGGCLFDKINNICFSNSGTGNFVI